MLTSCPSCGVSLPEDPSFPRASCPACGDALDQAPLVRGVLPAPRGLHDFLDLCGPHRDAPATPAKKDLDDITAIVAIVPKKKKAADREEDDVTDTVIRRPKGKSRAGR